ncbi:MAG: M28 family peptidase [Gemmatimonadales bacterium]|nr:M28 family peptidase [Gemmatimonadales bacterium]
MPRPSRLAAVVFAVLLAVASTPARAQDASLSRLLGALAGDTPLGRDLAELADEIGGRATGSPANVRSVEWALAKFRAAGVMVRKEAFTMPDLWLERSAAATVRGSGVEFAPRIAAMPWSAKTGSSGVTAPLVDAGRGTEADLARLGTSARGAFLLVETDELRDIDGLFKEYNESVGIEARANAAGAAGVVYQGSRPGNQLYRHNVNIGLANTKPMVVMERDGASRAQRLLRRGLALQLTVRLDLQTGGPYESWNVIGELRGREKPDEVVLLGAHLDSWDLGTGVLDNGANVVMLIDLARQMQALGLQPKRTIRFALFNGEEQEMEGSWGYVKRHRDALDRHVLTSSFDIGCGRLTGMFTGGRPEVQRAVERALAPVAGLGPFTHPDVPIVGTDNYDFMLEGVPNVVGNHEPDVYGPNYHARSDELARCDLQKLRTNAQIVAALAWGFANDDYGLRRQSRAELEQLMATTDLPAQMKAFNVWEGWAKGERGRR